MDINKIINFVKIKPALLATMPRYLLNHCYCWLQHYCWCSGTHCYWDLGTRYCECLGNLHRPVIILEFIIRSLLLRCHLNSIVNSLHQPLKKIPKLDSCLAMLLSVRNEVFTALEWHQRNKLPHLSGCSLPIIPDAKSILFLSEQGFQTYFCCQWCQIFLLFHCIQLLREF